MIKLICPRCGQRFDIIQAKHIHSMDVNGVDTITGVDCPCCEWSIHVPGNVSVKSQIGYDFHDLLD